jgi:hypothetical protein
MYCRNMPWEAQRWSGDIAPLILNLGARWGWVVNATPSVLIVLKSGILNHLEPSGPLQACSGVALPFYRALFGCPCDVAPGICAPLYIGYTARG